MIAAIAIAAILGLVPADPPATPTATTPTPAASATASPSATPAPAASATASPAITLSPATAEYAGQVLDLERGYIVFATGDALRMAPDAQVVDAASGAPLPATVEPGQYAAITLDQTGEVKLVRVADVPIAAPQHVSEVPRAFVVKLSPNAPNPDLIPPARALPVSKLSPTEQVSITVTVPPQTPFSDDVYISTDTSGWNPQAVKMQRIDGRRFRVTMTVQPGSQFRYLFTRGSWQTVESDAAGLRRSARHLFAEGAVALTVDATVERWLDVP